MAAESPRYHILSFTTANRGEQPEWFSLEVQVHNTSFRIHVQSSNFRDSPARFEEFRTHFRLLLSEHGQGDDLDLFECTEDEKDEKLLDCFDWAVIPCLAQFERLSPPPPRPETGPLTLSYFLVTTSFECELVATNETLAPGTIEPLEVDDDDYWGPQSPTDEPAQATPQTVASTFPSFTPDEIIVIPPDDSDSHHPSHPDPTRVRIGSQHLFFKPTPNPGPGPDNPPTHREILTYSKIALANFAPEIRTSRLYGTVQHKHNPSQILGLLLHPIEESPNSPLTYAAQDENTSDISKERWARQIQQTLTALHSKGIVWGDAKPDNVLIDVHGDAWVVDFGGGRTEGWVDADGAGTVEGDLQGLERILGFIEGCWGGRDEIEGL